MALTYDHVDPNLYNLDGAIEFPPHNSFKKLPSANAKLKEISKGFSGQLRNYEHLIEYFVTKPKNDFDLVKCVLPQWDNEARRSNSGYGFIGSSPHIYQVWLSEAIQFSIKNPIKGISLVAINAWNEWAEGAHLEPDMHYGSSYLNATARALLEHC